MFLIETETLLRDIELPGGQAPVSMGLAPSSIGWIHINLCLAEDVWEWGLTCGKS